MPITINNGSSTNLTHTGTVSTNVHIEVEHLSIDVQLRITDKGIVVDKSGLTGTNQSSFVAPYLPMHSNGLIEGGTVPWTPVWTVFISNLNRMVFGSTVINEERSGRKTKKKGPDGWLTIRREVKKLWLQKFEIDDEYVRWVRRVRRTMIAWRSFMLSGQLVSNLYSGGIGRILGLDLSSYTHLLMGLVLDAPTRDARKWLMHDIAKLSPVLLMEFSVNLHRYCPMHNFRRYVGETRYSIRGNTYQAHMETVHDREKGLDHSLVPDVNALVKSIWKTCYNGKLLKPHTVGCMLSSKIVKGTVPDSAWHALLISSISGGMKTYRVDDDGGLEAEEPTAIKASNEIYHAIKNFSKWVGESKPSDLLALDWHLLAPGKVLRQEEKDLLEANTALSWDNPLNGWFSDVDKHLGVKEPKEIVETTPYRFILDNMYQGSSTSWVTAQRLLGNAIKYIQDGMAIYNNYVGTVSETSDGEKVRAMPIKGSLSRMLKDAKYNHNIERYLIEAKIKDIPTDEPLWCPGPGDPAIADPELESKRVKYKAQLVLIGKYCRHCVGTRKDTTNSLFYWDGSTVVAEVKGTSPNSKYVNMTKGEFDDLDKMHGVGVCRRWGVSECRDVGNKTTEASTSFNDFLSNRLSALYPQKEEAVAMEDVHILNPVHEGIGQGIQYDEADGEDVEPQEGNYLQFPANETKRVPDNYLSYSTGKSFSVTCNNVSNKLKILSIKYNVNLESKVKASSIRVLSPSDYGYQNSYTGTTNGQFQAAPQMPHVFVNNGELTVRANVIKVSSSDSYDEVDEDMDECLEVDFAEGGQHE